MSLAKRKNRTINNVAEETHESSESTFDVTSQNDSGIHELDHTAMDIEDAPEEIATDLSGAFETSNRDSSGNREDDVDFHYVVQTEQVAKSTQAIEGRRIVDLGFVLKETLQMERQHRSICTGSFLELEGESRRGLSSSVIFKCRACNRHMRVATENLSSTKADVNVAAVLGSYSCGIGYSQLQELMATMDIPIMSKWKYGQHEQELEEEFLKSLTTKMQEAAEDEKNNAIAHGNVDPDGVPWITVYVDGGWSRRSYGHNYNAASGVACIIGQHTKKLIFLGVRNKYCSVCASAVAKNQSEPPPHKCYRNWSGSSCAMEQDIIVQGFCMSESMYGLRYKKVIGDGDSSVYRRILDTVPYGRHVVKEECANHSVKNYTGALHRLRTNTKEVPLEARKVLAQVIPRLTSAVRGAIRFNAENGGSAADLRKDLLNGPCHIFGNHQKCREYFCKTPGDVSSDKTPKMQEIGVMTLVMCTVDQLTRKSEQLLANETTNAAESYMSMLAKFNSGKRINFTKRGSFQRRCLAAGLSYQGRGVWQGSPWKNIAKRSPGTHFKRYLARKKKYQSSRCGQRTRKCSRKLSLPEIDRDYGKHAVKPDISEQQMAENASEKLSRLQVTVEQRDAIERRTVGQSDNQLWKLERQDRLTASLFGQVCCRKTTTSCQNLVLSILHPRPVATTAVEYGKNNEKLVKALFEKNKNKSVNDCGLFVDLDCGFLAASPDGTIQGEDAIIEIKTFPASQGLSWTEFARKRGTCLEETRDGNLRVKRTHKYYFQVQGQLNITRHSLCYFVGFIGMNTSLYVEEILRDDDFWKTRMLPKMIQFYKECMLPEIIDSRSDRGLPVREPQHILDAQTEARRKATTRKEKKGNKS